jgi:Fic family protein
VAGREVTIIWRGRRAKAWLPELLETRRLDLSEATVRRTEQAAAAARRSADELPARWEPLARLLLRAEGVASSFIEGVRAPLTDVAAAELDPTIGEPATWVADNLKTVMAAVTEAPSGRLSFKTLHRWHRSLMRDASHLPAGQVGAFRRTQGWIGGTSPLDAALVTPPPDEVPRLTRDLVAFANRTDVDPVTQAAVAHAQFEIIHPYADGNGRIGRVLIGWLLTRRLDLVSPPPVSVRIASDRGAYLAGLTQFRLGEADQWVQWFAEVVRDASNATIDLVRNVDALVVRWNERLVGVRIDAAARRVLPLLPEFPVVSADIVASALDISERSGRTALGVLAEHGIVVPLGRRSHPGRPRRWWMAHELVDLVTSWSR